MAAKQVKTYQEQVTEIDQSIEALLAKKQELAVLMLKEINEAVEMPLHQLNAIASIGYDAAKKQYGDKWVE